MRYLIVLLFLLAGCSELYQPPGRFQLLPAPGGFEVWRLDTATGDVARCLMAEGKVRCFGGS